MDRLVLLDIGGYEWLDWRLRPDYFLGPLVIEGAYLWAIAWLRPRISDAGRVKRSQVLAFSLGGPGDIPGHLLHARRAGR